MFYVLRDVDLFVQVFVLLSGHDDRQYVSNRNTSTSPAGGGKEFTSRHYKYTDIKLAYFKTTVSLFKVAVGTSHVTVVTLEGSVYTWGDNGCGQLGQGDLINRDKPTLVDSLKGKSITR